VRSIEIDIIGIPTVYLIAYEISLPDLDIVLSSVEWRLARPMLHENFAWAEFWMGHKRIEETMLYVHVAENHRRDIPGDIASAARREVEPDRRVLRMLGARGSHGAANGAPTEPTLMVPTT